MILQMVGVNGRLPPTEKNMSLTQEDVEKIAHLARLELTDAEKAQYLEQLTAVLDYADMLNELDLADILPTAHAIVQHNVMREDVVQPSLPIEDVLFNAVKHAQNQFRIQAVLDDN
jgi:aspartyl-tRNA(Asn)/glutamyl-tRNA(Gln) amidotransferase subunit C